MERNKTFQTNYPSGGDQGRLDDTYHLQKVCVFRQSLATNRGSFNSLYVDMSLGGGEYRALQGQKKKKTTFERGNWREPELTSDFSDTGGAV